LDHVLNTTGESELVIVLRIGLNPLDRTNATTTRNILDPECNDITHLRTDQEFFGVMGYFGLFTLKIRPIRHYRG
jgi:hypothetical protein